MKYLSALIALSLTISEVYASNCNIPYEEVLHNTNSSHIESYNQFQTIPDTELATPDHMPSEPEPVNKKHKKVDAQGFRIKQARIDLLNAKEKARLQVSALRSSGTLKEVLGSGNDIGSFKGVTKDFGVQIMRRLPLRDLFSMRLTCKTFATLSQAEQLSDVYCMTMYDLEAHRKDRLIPMGAEKSLISYQSYINKKNKFVNFHPSALKYIVTHDNRDFIPESGFSLSNRISFNKGLATFIFDTKNLPLFVHYLPQLKDVLFFRENIKTLVLPSIQEPELLLLTEYTPQTLLDEFVNVKKLVLNDSTVTK